ncbi:MAG: hypothetical protein H6518_10335 [Microthrixaceae bacterium]|nr:hypothetical protein [Microthrixaceae bacterium]
MPGLNVPPPERRGPFVGGLVAALCPPGRALAPVQQSVLDAIRTAFRGGVEGDGPGAPLPAVEPLAAADAAAALSATELDLLAHAVAAFELIAHPLDPEVEHHAARYVAQLGVRAPELSICRETARGELALLHADFIRHSWTTEVTLHEGFLHGRLLELARSKAAYYGVGGERHVARRWEALRDRPTGSWGRTVADFYERHRFPFPGEPHGIYEVGAAHDWVHVLCDYGTDPEGEIEVFGFIAGASDDPRAFVNFAFTLALFQNATIDTVGGKKVAIARADTLSEPGATARFADALRRSMDATADVIALDHFAYADLPLDEARARFGIAAKGVPGPGWRD